jgi:DtxR family Mn-dependent transcriptional regulator
MLTEGRQDCLEALLLCEQEHRVVRTKHLAQRLGVRSPSVHAAVKELTRLGLVAHESYGHVELTPAGRREAERVYAGHTTLRRLFRDILGLPEPVAEVSACGIEHHLDGPSLDKVRRLVGFIDRRARRDTRFARALKEALARE